MTALCRCGLQSKKIGLPLNREVRIGVTYSYTANGELLGKTEGGVTTSYHYDVLGNLTQVSLLGDVSVEYVIDARNRQIGRKVSGALAQGICTLKKPLYMKIRPAWAASPKRYRVPLSYRPAVSYLVCCQSPRFVPTRRAHSTQG